MNLPSLPTTFKEDSDQWTSLQPNLLSDYHSSLLSILYKLRESTFSMLPKHNSGAFYPHKTELSKKTQNFPRKLLMENDEVKCFLMIIYRHKYGFS